MSAEDTREFEDLVSRLDDSVLGPPPLARTVAVMLTIYFAILVPWIPFFTLMGSGMAFEAGKTFDAYAFVVTAWGYPVLVAISYFFRRRKPQLIWLPMIALAALLFQA